MGTIPWSAHARRSSWEVTAATPPIFRRAVRISASPLTTSATTARSTRKPMSTLTLKQFSAEAGTTSSSAIHSTTFSSNAGNDTVWAGAGKDTLDGGGGRDMLY